MTAIHQNGDLTSRGGIGKTAAAVFVFYAVALLLNAEGLLRSASLMPYGRSRQLCMALVRPVAIVGERTRLTLLREKLEQGVHEHLRSM